MIKTVLSKTHKIQASFDGHNSPNYNLSYLLGINDQTEAAVFEMGVGKPGDLKYTCKHYRPQVGILLNIGIYHLQGCGTLSRYIGAKAELLKGITTKGTLIINADDENIKKIDMTSFKGNIISFGINSSSQYKAKDISSAEEGINFVLVYQGNHYPVYVPGYGEHNIYNALATIAATHSIGIELEDSIKRLSTYKPVCRHLQIKPGINKCSIIDDTWSCTPFSFESAIKALKQTGASKKKVAVFGCMPRLGAAGKSEYYRIGKLVAEAKFDYIITIDSDAKKIGQTAIEKGMDKNRVMFCYSAPELYKALVPLTNQDVVVLFKFPYKYRLSKEPAYVEFMKKIFK